MSKPNPTLWWLKLSAISRYTIAVMVVAATIFAMNFIAPFLHTEVCVSLFICTIMFVAWFCGFGPALFTTALSVVALHYYLVESNNLFTAKSNLFAVDIKELPRIVLFTIAALFVNFLSAAQRGAAKSLRRSRDDVRRSEAFLVEGQKISHTGTWSWNISSGKLAWSDEHFRIFGVDPKKAELTFQLFQSKVHPEDRSLVQQTLDRAILDRSSFSLDYRIVLPDGSVKHLHGMSRPVLTEADELDGYIGATMDITERRHAEETLRDAQADLTRVARLTTLGELAASLVHEISQPLAAIALNAASGMRWLNQDRPNLEEAREALSCIELDSTRGGDVIRGLRALAQKSGPQLARLDIRDAIEEMLALTRGELQRHGILLHADLSATDQPVLGDRVQLQQVLLNLIMNGIQAMTAVTDRERELSVSVARAAPDRMRVTVEDTGPGLDPTIAQRIFEPFFTTKSGGLGMGLSICRSIIEAHGGQLRVSARTPHGAAFYFTIPVTAAG